MEVPNQKQPAIYWFRRDLRLADNPALQRACQHQSVILIYIACDTDWSPGAASSVFLHHALQGLAKDITQRQPHQTLHILQCQSPAEAIYAIAHQYGAKAVYWNRRYEPAEIAIAKDVKQRLTEAGFQASSFGGNLLAEPWDTLKKDGTPYQVYTPYCRAFVAKLNEVTTFDDAKLPPPPPTGLTKNSTLPNEVSLDELRLLPDRPWGKSMMTHWQCSRTQALRSLKAFCTTKIESYVPKRDIPKEHNTSRLSPYLHFGILSPREVWLQASASIKGDAFAHPSVGQFQKELIWREFAHHLLFYFPTTPREPLKPAFSNFPWQANPSALKKWQNGQTGYPIIDAGMRELWQTGFMHNRVRMIVGSFLVKHLRIHWLSGAEWFWDTLVDADLANNTFGWQWCAGSGADAAPYFRIFNPVTQSKKFDPYGGYIRTYCPELKNLPDKHIHAPYELDAATLKSYGIVLGNNYPRPIIDLKKGRDLALSAYEVVKASSTKTSK